MMLLLTDNLLLNYKRCSRRTFLDLYGNPQEKDPAKDFLLKLQRENASNIRRVLQERSLLYQQPSVSRHDWQLNSQQTVDLMQQGAECINNGTLYLTCSQWLSVLPPDLLEYFKKYQQTFIQNTIFLAAPTLLIKQPGKSQFGNWQYIPVNIKLGRRPKSEYKLIATFHAQILAVIQGVIPSRSELILRQSKDYSVNLEYWLTRMHEMVTDCLETIATKSEPEVFISRQKCSLCHWYSHCYATAKSVQHLSLIPGITPKRYEDLNAIGVNNLESLNNTSEHLLQEIMDNGVVWQLKQQLASLESGRAILKSNYNLSVAKSLPTTEIELYFDIEAEPELQIDYLLGVVLVDRVENTAQFYSFLAEHPEEEGAVWQQFVDFITLYPDAPIFHYSEYEVDTIKRLAKLYDTPQIKTQLLLSRLVDLHQWVRESIVFPVENYSLKSLANWLGFSWREAEGSGDQSVCWYDRWLTTQDRSWLDAILRYNEDDCLATLYLKNWLVEFLASQD